MRLSTGAGIGIEIGPYTLDSEDIELLRAAIAGYDACRQTERRTP